MQKPFGLFPRPVASKVEANQRVIHIAPMPHPERLANQRKSCDNARTDPDPAFPERLANQRKSCDNARTDPDPAFPSATWDEEDNNSAPNFYLQFSIVPSA
jgi:hypothetical protein